MIGFVFEISNEARLVFRIERFVYVLVQVNDQKLLTIPRPGDEPTFRYNAVRLRCFF